MRTNLNCPFHEKDEAKRLGARWDPAGKTWYIFGAEDLTPFMRWISPPSGKPKKRAGFIPKITCSEVDVPHCGCDHVLPWEDCEHTEAALDAEVEKAFVAAMTLGTGAYEQHLCRQTNKMLYTQVLI